MKTVFLLFLLLPTCSNVSAQSRGPSKNAIYDIFPGDYADPSILRDGKDFYMTHSTTSLIVWHSTNLTNWRPISRALPHYSKSVWAPEIVKYHDRYFIYYPDNGKIFVVSADNPKGPWSRPITLELSGIDPGIIVTSAGKRLLYLNDGKMVPLTDRGLAQGMEPVKVYNGWAYPPNWVEECFCLESPKLFFHQGYYYMVSAQGGTSGPATSHMAVLARSEKPDGPWENSPYNPLIKTFRNTEKTGCHNQWLLRCPDTKPTY